MKNDLDNFDPEIRLGVYNKLREKIKTLVGDKGLDNKECVDKIRGMLEFLKAGDIEE